MNGNFNFSQEEKARKVEETIQVAIGKYIRQHCLSCNEPIFQGQLGVFVCHDNPHMTTYRICLHLARQNVPGLLGLIELWVKQKTSA